ncbi:MAG: LPXTG cell wall anchor domain-containing protein [Clostridia bacterium]|nr:LPXTG cell wall anchor domain-containing protein [Clostridia bacterium]
MPEPAPTPDIPKTGDSTDMVPFAIIAIIAVLGIFGSTRFGRKRTK